MLNQLLLAFAGLCRHSFKSVWKASNRWRSSRGNYHMGLTSVMLQRLSKRANTWYKWSFITFFFSSQILGMFCLCYLIHLLLRGYLIHILITRIHEGLILRSLEGDIAICMRFSCADSLASNLWSFSTRSSENTKCSVNQTWWHPFPSITFPFADV